MSQGSHSPDTLFIVVEPDMCMYKVDAAARLELVQNRMPEDKFQNYESFGASIDDPVAKESFMKALEQWRTYQKECGLDNVPWPRNADQPASRAPVPPWHKPKPYSAVQSVPAMPKKEKATNDESKLNCIPMELHDLVLYSNAAARLGRDGLLWGGWNASQWSETKSARSCSPASGAHLVMVSTKGARFLMDKRDEIPNMHMGNFLAKKCGLEWQEELGSAYICPPIGSYSEHESTTTPGQVLMSHFDAIWAQEGTRPLKVGDKPRFICGFTEKGPANFLHKTGLDFSCPEVRKSYNWVTQAPPGMPDHIAGLQRWHTGIAEDLSPSPHTWYIKYSPLRVSSQPPVGPSQLSVSVGNSFTNEFL